MKAFIVAILALTLLSSSGTTNKLRVLPTSEFYWNAFNQTVQAILQQILVYRKAAYSSLIDYDDTPFQNSLVTHVNDLLSCMQNDMYIPEMISNISIALQAYDPYSFDINTADLSHIADTVYPIFRLFIDLVGYCAGTFANWEGNNFYFSINNNLSITSIYNELLFLKSTNPNYATYYIKSILQSIKGGYYSNMGQQMAYFYYTFYPIPDVFVTFWTNALGSLLTSVKNVIISARSNIYKNVLLNEIAIEGIISSEIVQANNCLKADLIFLHMLANFYHQYQNNSQDLHWENIDSNGYSSIALGIYQAVAQFQERVSNCLFSTTLIGPYVSHLISQDTIPNIVAVLTAQSQNSATINTEYQQLMLGMSSKNFEQIGLHLMNLYFIFKPIPAPPSTNTLGQYFIQAWNAALLRIKIDRSAKYGTGASEVQIEQEISNDFNTSLSCIKGFSRSFRNKITQVVYYLIYTFSGYDASSFYFNYANLTSLANDLYYIILEGYNDISSCLSSTTYVGPYLDSLMSEISASNIEEKLASLSSISNEITSNAHGLITAFQNLNFEYVGIYVVELYLLAYPLQTNFRPIQPKINPINIPVSLYSTEPMQTIPISFNVEVSGQNAPPSYALVKVTLLTEDNHPIETIEKMVNLPH